MKYQFSSLNSIADWCENKGVEKRNSLNGKMTKLRAKEIIAEASVYENIADMLRHSTITVDSQ